MSSNTWGHMLLFSILWASSVDAEPSPSIHLTLDPEFEIGLEEERPLGRVVDMAISADGHLYVLDAGFVQLLEFGSEGESLRQLSGEGEGPGELQCPRALTVGPEGRIYVVGTSTRVAVVDPRGDHDTLRIDYLTQPRGIALLPGGDYLISGFDRWSGMILHRYDRTTQERVASFCESYGKDVEVDPEQERIEAGGFVRCVGDRLTYLQMNPSEIEVYDLDAGLLFRHEAFTKYAIPTRPMVRNGDARTYTLPQSGSLSLVPMGEDRFLTAMYRIPDLDDRETAESILGVYSSSTGECEAETRRPGFFVPRCLDSRGYVYVSEVEDDIPVIRRYRLRMAGIVSRNGETFRRHR